MSANAHETKAPAHYHTVHSTQSHKWNQSWVWKVKHYQPRVTMPSAMSEKSNLARATSFYGNQNPSPDSINSKGTRGRGSIKRSSMSNTENPKRKKRKIVEDNTVVIYNIPPMTDRATLENFVERMFLEMHGKRIKILRLLCISNVKVSDPVTFLATFETPELVDLAISLNGVRFLDNNIFVSIYNPDWKSDQTSKLRLCFNYFFGGCKLGKNCRHAHGVLGLKLYHKTVLHENRTVYINHVPVRYPPGHLLSTVRKKFEQHGLFPFFTAFHVRGEKGDALVEFADIRHAKIALDILNGTRIGTCQVEARPWKPEYQWSFVRYLMDEARARTDGNWQHASASESPPTSTSTRTNDIRRRVASVPFANLEEENIACKRKLDEALDEARYYRDAFERERSYAKDASRMEENLVQLQQENDHLMRENDHLRQRCHHGSSRSLGSFHDTDSDIRDELHNTRLKYEESRHMIYDLKCELDKTMQENEVLVKVSNRLKSTVEHLESNRNLVKRENEQANRQDELQRRLDEALSTVETLNGVVTTTQQQLRDLESKKESMEAAMADIQVENETLEEEIEQMRQNHAMELGYLKGDDA